MAKKTRDHGTRTKAGTPPHPAAAGREVFSPAQWLAIADSLRLSEREHEVVRCLFDDMTEAAIARELGISSHTVHTHLERLYRKLGVASRVAAIVSVVVAYIDTEQAVSPDQLPPDQPTPE